VNMETSCFSETLASTYNTTWHQKTKLQNYTTW
jgi:hypothetical protein